MRGVANNNCSLDKGSADGDGAVEEAARWLAGVFEDSTAAAVADTAARPDNDKSDLDFLSRVTDARTGGPDVESDGDAVQRDATLLLLRFLRRRLLDLLCERPTAFFFFTAMEGALLRHNCVATPTRQRERANTRSITVRKQQQQPMTAIGKAQEEYELVCTSRLCIRQHPYLMIGTAYTCFCVFLRYQLTRRKKKIENTWPDSFGRWNASTHECVFNNNNNKKTSKKKSEDIVNGRIYTVLQNCC